MSFKNVWGEKVWTKIGQLVDPTLETSQQMTQTGNCRGILVGLVQSATLGQKRRRFFVLPIFQFNLNKKLYKKVQNYEPAQNS